MSGRHPNPNPNPNPCVVVVVVYRMEVWPGYVTSVKEYDGGLMCLVDTLTLTLTLTPVLLLLFQNGGVARLRDLSQGV